MPIEIELKERQFEVFTDEHRFIVLVAGRRWAKTTTLITKLITKAFEKRGLYGYFAPTYKQAKLIAWDILKGISPREYVLKINESELCITYKNLSKIRLFGLDKAENLLGIKLHGALIDEYDQVKTNVYEAVIRPALSDSLGFCWFTGSPDCRKKRLKELFEDAKINPKKRAEWKTFHFRSVDGGYIPADEIENARATMDPRTFREQYEATFEDAMGRVYYAFNFDENVTERAKYNPHLTLRVFWDFNVDPFCVGFGHTYETIDPETRTKRFELHVFDELVIRNSNTLEMCRAIADRYGKHVRGMVHYGDATSKARNTASSLSDYQIIYDFFRNQPGGCGMRFKDANPSVKDRINAVNSMLQAADMKRRLFINPSCKKIIKDLMDVSYKEGTVEIDKSNLELTHASDGLGYWIDYDHPVIRTYIRT